MKALTFHQHGSLENVRVGDVPDPVPGPGEALIEIRAAALNRLDLWVLEGWPGLNLPLPHIMGSDGAGVIVAVGDQVGEAWGSGDRVVINPTIIRADDDFVRRGLDNMSPRMAILGEHVDGTVAQYIAVPAANLLRIPDEVPFTTAAAAALVFVTAWHSLITRGQFQAGEEILVIGAGGGVNTATIQIARLAGARRIFVVGSTDEKLAQAGELGADVLINRHKEDWGKAVYRETGRQGVDVVVDNVGAPTFPGALRALKRGGRLLTVGNTAGPRFEIDNRLIFGKHLSIIGSTMGPRHDFTTVMDLIFSGQLTPVIDSVTPLSESVGAVERLAQGDVIGKLVITP
jgi:NADPH:quinone reductase-like Zn-dependent oxidoreductase